MNRESKYGVLHKHLPIFHVKKILILSLAAICSLYIGHFSLFTNNIKNFKVFIYVGVLLIQIKFICVLTRLVVEITCWLNFAYKNTHQCNGNGRLWEN